MLTSDNPSNFPAMIVSLSLVGILRVWKSGWNIEKNCDPSLPKYKFFQKFFYQLKVFFFSPIFYQLYHVQCLLDFYLQGFLTFCFTLSSKYKCRGSNKTCPLGIWRRGDISFWVHIDRDVLGHAETSSRCHNWYVNKMHLFEKLGLRHFTDI